MYLANDIKQGDKVMVFRFNRVKFYESKYLLSTERTPATWSQGQHIIGTVKKIDKSGGHATFTIDVPSLKESAIISSYIFNEMVHIFYPTI